MKLCIKTGSCSTKSFGMSFPKTSYISAKGCSIQLTGSNFSSNSGLRLLLSPSSSSFSSSSLLCSAYLKIQSFMLAASSFSETWQITQLSSHAEQENTHLASTQKSFNTQTLLVSLWLLLDALGFLSAGFCCGGGWNLGRLFWLSSCSCWLKPSGNSSGKTNEKFTKTVKILITPL